MGDGFSQINEVEFWRTEAEHLRGFIESKGWCLPAGMETKRCDKGPCDCFVPEWERQVASGALTDLLPSLRAMGGDAALIADLIEARAARVLSGEVPL